MQLRFTRDEFKRGLRGRSPEDGQRRVPPMNSISWNIGHLAWQEQRYWLRRGQDRVPLADVQDQFASDGPPRSFSGPSESLSHHPCCDLGA